MQSIVPGTLTPWGPAETVVYWHHGVTEVITNTHGGFHIQERQLMTIPAIWRLARHGDQATLTSPWFEEDVDWALAALALGRPFTGAKQARADIVFQHFFDTLSRDEMGVTS